jgi:hypothetical protein
MVASKARRRASRKHAVASLLLPEERGAEASQSMRKHLRKLFEAAGAHSEDFWEKLRRYTTKILEAARAPVCNMMQVPITFVDAAREIVRFLCQQISACARRSQTHLGGAACGEAAFFVQEALDDMAKTLAATLAWLTSERFWRELRAFLKQGASLPAEACEPLARMTYRQRAVDVAKTVLELPQAQRQAYLGGLKALGEAVLNFGRGRTHMSNVVEEVCLKNTLDAVKKLTEVSPNSWLSKDLIFVLSKTLSVLWERPSLFS